MIESDDGLDYAELVAVFRAETVVFCQELEVALATLRAGPPAERDAALHTAIRLAHNIKGGALCVQEHDVAAAARTLEAALRRLRQPDAVAGPVDLQRLEDLVVLLTRLALPGPPASGSLALATS